ncbi:alpha/beta fold hydrolase [Amycolatopsis sp. NPDC048633]|uniref:alpha/beta hydrolase n=1 Tax=Amycolatopsis sp. NPDC048633 TaxID=3157095 RepID=UPI0033C6D834
MRTSTHRFYSDGLRIDGTFYLPDDRAEPRRQLPLLVVCSGFTGLCKIHPERFARWFTRQGYACFGFDYRGFGNSEGVRFRVLLEEQVRDIRNAVTFASTSQYIDSENVFLAGWAMGGGLVLDAARELPELTAIAAINGLFDGVSFQLSHRGPEGLVEFREKIRAERLRRTLTGIAEYVDPFEIYPLDQVTRNYVTASLESVEGYDDTVCSFELAESLLRWSVLPAAAELRLPLFLAHGDRNELHLAEQADDLEARYGGPVEALTLTGAGHTEWMHDGNPVFGQLCEQLHSWLKTVTN